MRDPNEVVRLALRRGEPVILSVRAERFVVLALDGLSETALGWFQSLAAGTVALVVGAPRAAALGRAVPGAGAVVRIPLAASILASVEDLSGLANPLLPPSPELSGLGEGDGGDMGALAALHLAKQAELLPALLMAPADEVATADRPRVAIGDVLARSVLREAAIRRVGTARVPLHDAAETEIIAFRPGDGGLDQLAIVIGQPDFSQPVLTRLHSSCLTGDLIGSLRCDCGDQLRGAIRSIAATGGGVILYLAQEGRGIGIANKLRAYALQDRGADTLEANEQLGFASDERSYTMAAAMLRDLGVAAVRLMTNNPLKLSALAEAGIEIVERVQHSFPANPHNERYLETKATRSGHLL